ncbi:MAG: CarD family transcriptional regulator [Lachnospiraceae bacterium]|nr:CarD family transcriptional regulator [Lachnospiraceae bacterium]
MFEINDAVIYGNQGLCKIEEIGERDFTGVKRVYYVMRPVYQSSSTIYVPIDNEMSVSRMKKILSVEEIKELICNMPQENTKWIENDSVRKEKFRQILKEGSRSDLIGLIRAVYFHKRDIEEKGKKLHIADENAMKEAEKLLYDEFAYVLQIERTEVLNYIISSFEKN